MLNTLIGLSLETVGKQGLQASRTRAIGGSGAALGAYPVLRTMLLRAERRGALENERQKMLARLGSY